MGRDEMMVQVRKLLHGPVQQLASWRPEDTIQTMETSVTAKDVGARPVCDESEKLSSIISDRNLAMTFARRNGEAGALN